MAEVSGLTMGTIALASLFSTCKELLDYFELGKSYAYDYEIAMTKVLLLNARLRRWGDTLDVENPGHEADMLRRQWQEEQNIIGENLLGIKSIFGDAQDLTQKYGLNAQRRPMFEYISASHPRLREVEQKLRVRQHKRRNLTSFRKKIVWAIHDKKKFDSLIVDLDFFITNLELVSGRLQPQSQQPSFFENTLNSLRRPEAISLISKAMVGPTSKPSTSDTKSAVSGHQYTENGSEDNAILSLGDTGEVSPQSKTHNYVKNKAKGYSTALLGNMGEVAFTALLEKRTNVEQKT